MFIFKIHISTNNNVLQETNNDTHILVYRCIICIEISFIYLYT